MLGQLKAGDRVVVDGKESEGNAGILGQVVAAPLTGFTILVRTDQGVHLRVSIVRLSRAEPREIEAV